MSGYKTYLAAAALALYAVGGLVAGKLTFADTLPLFAQAAALAGLRNAIANQ